MVRVGGGRGAAGRARVSATCMREEHGKEWARVVAGVQRHARRRRMELEIVECTPTQAARRFYRESMGAVKVAKSTSTGTVRAVDVMQ